MGEMHQRLERNALERVRRNLWVHLHSSHLECVPFDALWFSSRSLDAA
jgi:hypothetical protein